MAVDVEFAKRLERVQAGVVGCNRTIYIGIDEAYYVPAAHKDRVATVSTGEQVSNLLHLLSFGVALALGYASDGLGRYIRFQIMPDIKLDATTEMVMNASVGLFVGLFLSLLFRLRSNDHRVMIAIGAFISVCTFHNLVHWYPAFFDQMFSPMWTARITSATKPDSILFRGISFVLSG